MHRPECSSERLGGRDLSLWSCAQKTHEISYTQKKSEEGERCAYGQEVRIRLGQHGMGKG
jgi:hypothetical protein